MIIIIYGYITLNILLQFFNCHKKFIISGMKSYLFLNKKFGNFFKISTNQFKNPMNSIIHNSIETGD